MSYSVALFNPLFFLEGKLFCEKNTPNEHDRFGTNDHGSGNHCLDCCRDRVCPAGCVSGLSGMCGNNGDDNIVSKML